MKGHFQPQQILTGMFNLSPWLHQVFCQFAYKCCSLFSINRDYCQCIAICYQVRFLWPSSSIFTFTSFHLAPSHMYFNFRRISDWPFGRGDLKLRAAESGLGMSRPRLLFCYPARKQTFRGNDVRFVTAVHLWLRAETKPNERRTHITPERCKDLVQAGKKNLRALTLFKIVYNIPSPASAFYSYCWTFHIFQQHPLLKDG